MKKRCLAAAECPLARAYNAMGDWWSLLIVSSVLIGGLRRFGEIQETLGMARNILTVRLAKLVENGILEKIPASDGSSYHEYAPTQKGKDLHVAVVSLRQWGEKYFFTEGACGNQLVDRDKEKPIPEVQVRSADKRVLQSDDLRVIEFDRNFT